MNSQKVLTPDGIDWHVESIQSRAASAPKNEGKEQIVLIPSGEGDCHNLAALAINLASSAPVPTVITTFDYPGFSRTTAPEEAYVVMKPDKLAKQINLLLDQLEIRRATFWGSSAGGGAVLAIVALFPERVKCGVIHEVPFAPGLPLLPMRELTDEGIVKACHDYFYNWIEDENDGKGKYKALGEDYMRRLDKNFVVFIRSLVTNYEPRSNELATKENLRKRPLFWTVGGLSQRAIWKRDFELAESVGLEIKTDVLVCNHFPYVTIPQDTARWIWSCIENMNSSGKA